MKATGTIRFALVGAGLTAITFGLARYAFGLFVPAMRGELALAPDTIGLIGSLPFIAFALASVIAPGAASRMGARNAATTAGALATAGLALIARAEGAVALGTGVFICGLSTGLMMPGLTAGMQVAVPSNLRGRVTALMNAGTTVGIVACMPAVVLLSDDWRLAYSTFAVLAAIGMAAAWWQIPSASRVEQHAAAAPPRLSRRQCHALLRLVTFGCGAGVAASAFWIFAPDLVSERGELGSGATAGLWLAIGLAGIVGAWASDLADRIGSPGANALALSGIAIGTTLLALMPGSATTALAAAAVFGAAFMTLSGLHLVTAVRLLPNRPALAGVVPFLAITVGQAAGSPLVGYAIGGTDYTAAFQLFAALALVLAIASVHFPDPAVAPADEPAVPRERMASGGHGETAGVTDGSEPTEGKASFVDCMAPVTESVGER